MPRSSLIASVAWMMPISPGQHAQHAALGAARHQSRRRRLADRGSGSTGRRSVANTDAWPSKRKMLPYTFGFPQQHAGVVHQVAGGEVVGAVDDDVVVGATISSAFCGREPAPRRSRRARAGLMSRDPVARGVELRPADVGGAVDDLPLEVGDIDHVEVDDADAADAGRGQVEAERRAEAAGADQQHADALSFRCPSSPTSGMMRCRL